MIAERVGPENLKNVYTLAIHINSKTVYNISKAAQWLDHGTILGTVFLLSKADFATANISISQSFRLSVGSEIVSYDLAPAVQGFKAATFPEVYADAPPFSRSSWCRHHEGITKSFDGLSFTTRNVSDICDRLSVIQTSRYSALELALNPHRLEDYDEIWPSPVWASYSQGTVSIHDPYTVLPGRYVSLRGNIWNTGMITDSFDRSGIGPHQITQDADAVEDELTVDGVLMDKTLCPILRAIELNVGAQGTSQSIGMSRPKRSGVTATIGPRVTSTTRIGSANSYGCNRAISTRWRKQDSHNEFKRELIFDPSQPEPIKQAFESLRKLGTGNPPKHILVVDPFSLDRDALEAIVAIAAAKPANLRLDILTKFYKAPKQDEAFDERVKSFQASTEYVAGLLDIDIAVYQAAGLSLHDRFLFIDERVWHIGPSFNALGEDLAAAVEMTDLRAIAHLRELIEPWLVNPLIESNGTSA